MMVVLDTNVLVSGMFWTGPPNQILKAWISGLLTPIYTEEIFQEYTGVVQRYQAMYTLVDARRVLRLLEISGSRVIPARLEHQVCADPDDDKFLACALGAECGVTIIGDRHLLDVDGFEGIRVLTPRSFVDLYLDH